MSQFPPPQIPEHVETIRERFKRWPVWGQALTVVAVLAVAITTVVAVASNKKDDQLTARDQRLEVLRVTWNGLSAQQQFDICASVHQQGADVAADDVQQAAGAFSADAHDDIVFFLRDLACP